ncbi:hypothetical protein WG904_11775 [Pedobacter sp. Du54]|uniref:hypothetical protein n=1 Tax=Pedobacter anseongensis TaxID=3133439 RepID=UPI0030A2A457
MASFLSNTTVPIIVLTIKKTAKKMEWISFTLNTAKKNNFENELLPALWKSHGSLLEMSGLTWATYFEKTGIDSYHCLFYSDSGLFLKFVKAFAVDFSKVFSVPDISAMQYFGPENLDS